MATKKTMAVIISVLAFVSVTQAVVCDLGDSGWAMVIEDNYRSANTVSRPYVFGVIGDAVVIELDKVFGMAPDQYGLFAPITVEFMKISDNAVSNIVINDEYIINNTGHQWHDFHMNLVVTDRYEAGFVPVPVDGGQLENVYYDDFFYVGGGMDMAAEGGDGYGDGYELATELNFINGEGDGVYSGPAGNNVFRPGYLGGGVVISTNPDMAVGERFILKERPTMPEPTTIAIMLFGVLPAVLKRKRSK